MVFKILQDNVAELPIEVRLSTAAKSVITDTNNQVVGLVIDGKDGERRDQGAQGRHACLRRVRGQRRDEAAVLADDAGLSARPTSATPATASAWRRSWAPSSGTCGTSTAPTASSHTDPGLSLRNPNEAFSRLDSRKRAPRGGADSVDSGRWRADERFMNELPPYVQDQGARHLELFDSVTQTFPRIPAHIIVDEAGRRRYPLGNPTYNDRGVEFHLEPRQPQGGRARHPQEGGHHRRARRYRSAATAPSSSDTDRALERDVCAKEGRGLRASRRQP